MTARKPKAPECPHCYGPIEVLGRGRPPKFCSTYCRKANHAERVQNAPSVVACQVSYMAGHMRRLIEEQHQAVKRGTGSLSAEQLQRMSSLATLLDDEAARIDPARLL